ncbi:TRAP transporter large permease subunit, partial [candidate division KSB1 bacterium]|nr:TRAP transporter large permease subunit [candidate division KSB1 bacterium]NIR72346.1 TRAP transporter large permease subunit [candidate division KSB1 bacterium]NIS25052.1 TRAP transporter large permease subunit [candidate division KSB1 bacterium]NIT71973.1 TRAP transporter large permease subunit [candidate division KSB1 bacterium]NIU25729.1 TRAP transporter large permease subunit [candidate division KSB1 bacterium]
AILYYATLLLIVHFRAKLVGASAEVAVEQKDQTSEKYKGFLFFSAFVTLMFFLIIGYTPFRAVSLSLIVILILSVLKSQTRLRVSNMFEAMERAAHGGISLIAAASCVGLILGVVTLTGIGTKLPGTILPLAQNNLILALVLLMISTIILGMGLPSAVCYLLMATLIGPVLSDLGLVPLSAHLFIFYFGMMSMVTPPVALAAYTAAAIAGANIMQAGFAAFRFALVGFALPYAFVLRPELLILTHDGSPPGLFMVVLNVGIALLGIVALAASVSGYWFSRLNMWMRFGLLAAALVVLLTESDSTQVWLQGVAFGVVAVIAVLNWRSREAAFR